MDEVPLKTLRTWQKKLGTMALKVRAMQEEALAVYGDEYAHNITDEFDNVEVAIADSRSCLERMARLRTMKARP